jgi:hypothetical protein
MRRAVVLGACGFVQELPHVRNLGGQSLGSETVTTQIALRLGDRGGFDILTTLPVLRHIAVHNDDADGLPAALLRPECGAR